MKDQYQWQGEPVNVRFGFVVQYENIDKPIYWYNFECNTKQKLSGEIKVDHMVANDGRHLSLIPAIEVETQSGYKFLLANHFGIGVSKLLKGGWPNHAHFSLDGEFKESKAPYFKFTSFDLEGYEAHESARNTWQKKNYPVEFERIEALRRGAQKYSSQKATNLNNNKS